MDRLWTPWRYAYITGDRTSAAPAEGEPERRPGVPPSLSAWPGPDRGCVFCNLIGAVRWAETQGWSRDDAEHAAWVLHRGPETFLVLNAFPYANGHLMAVPYEHHASLAALPRSTAQELMDAARTAETALRRVYRPDGLNLGMNLGQAAGAGVADHLHLHALPRWSGDSNFMTVIGETRVLPEMLESSWTRLREVLQAADVAS